MKEWVVTFLNEDTRKIGFDLFSGADEAEAKRSFRACYRHHNYRILSCVETFRTEYYS